ncbi:Sbal_3080 family lipoprotein [Acinetobacter geminorum]|uniref:Sbal_3080 family lipoprotein n=1 Tax=Acinetobacter geminorum TaxID=2730922 RepID=UPI003AF5016B
MSRILIIAILATIISGCATTSVKQESNFDANQIKKICIENNPKVIVQNFEEIVSDRLQSHNIDTEVFMKGKKPEECEYVLKYTAYQKWDFTMVMNRADLYLYKENNKISSANYTLNMGGFLNPTKYKSNTEKLNPVVDQLIGK